MIVLATFQMSIGAWGQGLPHWSANTEHILYCRVLYSAALGSCLHIGCATQRDI